MRSQPLDFIGLMSGTSVDGVDGVLVRFEPATSEGQLQIQTLAQSSRDMPAALRATLLALARGDSAAMQAQAKALDASDALELAAQAANLLTDLYADVVTDLQAQAPGIRPLAIGAHGQTIRHRPARGFTLQLFNGARLAAHSGMATVCDFRSGDVALGGQGAPLVPLFHRHLLESASDTRIILNLGGIANLSLLHEGRAVGFDTGPACTLLDAWCQQHLGTTHDQNGGWAASGRADPALLGQCLRDPYFALPPPKSTGRERFSPEWLEAQLLNCPTPGRTPADVQATLSLLSARSIAEALASHPALAQSDARISIHACGGGVRNRQLMNDIGLALEQCFARRNVTLTDTQALGIEPQAMEACAFAWLAWQRWEGIALDAGRVTGSSRPTVMGALYLP